MTTHKDFQNMVWQREFDIADQETNLRAQRIERVRRATASCSSRTAGRTALPSPVEAPTTRELGAVAAHVLNLTRHGQTRLRQRGITVDQVVTLLEYGSATLARSIPLLPGPPGPCTHRRGDALGAALAAEPGHSCRCGR